MPTNSSVASSWLERTTGWSNSRKAWLSRSAVAWLLVTAIVAFAFSSRSNWTVHFLVPGVCLVCLAIFLRHELLKLFGPVLFYELIRLTRKRRTIVIRAAYA